MPLTSCIAPGGTPRSWTACFGTATSMSAVTMPPSAVSSFSVKVSLRRVLLAALLALDLALPLRAHPDGLGRERRQEELERLLQALDDHLGAGAGHLLVGLEVDVADVALRRHLEAARQPGEGSELRGSLRLHRALRVGKVDLQHLQLELRGRGLDLLRNEIGGDREGRLLRGPPALARGALTAGDDPLVAAVRDERVFSKRRAARRRARGPSASHRRRHRARRAGIAGLAGARRALGRGHTALEHAAVGLHADDAAPPPPLGTKSLKTMSDGTGVVFFGSSSTFLGGSLPQAPRPSTAAAPGRAWRPGTSA